MEEHPINDLVYHGGTKAAVCVQVVGVNGKASKYFKKPFNGLIDVGATIGDLGGKISDSVLKAINSSAGVSDVCGTTAAAAAAAAAAVLI